MAAGLIRIKRRIASIDSTRKITNAMEMVSAVKLRRKRIELSNTVNYTSMMGNIVAEAFKGIDQTDPDLSPYIRAQSDKNVTRRLFIAITSSLGLCGGYSLNVIKYLDTLIGADDEVLIIGTRGLSKLADSKVEINEEAISFLDQFSFAKVRELRERLLAAYDSKRFASVSLIYTHFKNSLTFVPQLEQLLPLTGLSSIQQSEESDDSRSSRFPPDFLPDRKEVFNLLIPKYLDSILYKLITESMVCEEGARRNAMESATDNADDLRDKLSVIYNKARQTAITSQINEIMTGRLADDE